MKYRSALSTFVALVFTTVISAIPLVQPAQADCPSYSIWPNALPNGAVYAASKWGLNGLSYSVAEELRNHKIRVTVICPGSTQTELSPHEGKASERMLQPSDVAHVVAMVVTQAPQSFASEILLRPTQKP